MTRKEAQYMIGLMEEKIKLAAVLKHPTLSSDAQTLCARGFLVGMYGTIIEGLLCGDIGLDYIIKNFEDKIEKGVSL